MKTIYYSKNESKSSLRVKVFKGVSDKLSDTPSMMTLGGHEGNCVKLFREINPKSIIVNVERDKSQLKKYLALGLDTHVYKGSLLEAVQKIKGKVDFLNYDAIGWVCEEMHKTLIEVNNNRKCTYLFLTIPFDEQRSYKEYQEEYLKWLSSIPLIFEPRKHRIEFQQKFIQRTMFNYELIGREETMSSGKRKAPVQNYLFKLK